MCSVGLKHSHESVSKSDRFALWDDFGIARRVTTNNQFRCDLKSRAQLFSSSFILVFSVAPNCMLVAWKHTLQCEPLYHTLVIVISDYRRQLTSDLQGGNRKCTKGWTSKPSAASSNVHHSLLGVASLSSRWQEHQNQCVGVPTRCRLMTNGLHTKIISVFTDKLAEILLHSIQFWQTGYFYEGTKSPFLTEHCISAYMSLQTYFCTYNIKHLDLSNLAASKQWN